MSLDLELDDAQQAIRDALASLCRDHCTDDAVKAATGTLPRDLWQKLAGVGVLSLATPEGDGGACELVAALESLGRFVFPGPLAGTFLATQVLGEDARRAVATGEAIVCVGTPPLLPFAPVADLFVEIDGERAFEARPRTEVQPVEMLGGEPWGRVELDRVADLGSARDALRLHDVVVAAYLSAAAARLVDDAAEHARTRRQFGRAIGEFQAVAHPLADAFIAVTAAATLARAAAFYIDRGDARAAATAAAARLTAERAGIDAVHVCHQIHGAIGITLEGPVFHVSRRIRQLASQPPRSPGAEDALLRSIESEGSAHDPAIR